MSGAARNWSRRILAGALVAGILVAGPTIVRAADAGDEIVARIGSIEVKASELRLYLDALGMQDQVALARDPALLSQSVRQMLAAKLVLVEAQAKRWDQRPEVAAQLERARQNALVESYLQSVSKPPSGFPSEAELQSAYEANKTAFLQPRQFHLAHILVAVSKDADKAAQDKARKKLGDVQKKLAQKNAKFSAIASTDSEDSPTAQRGGEIGWLTEAQITPELRRIVAGLAQDAITDPLQLDDGWHIVKLLETKPAYTRPLSEIRDQLAAQLQRERAAAERRAFLAQLLQKNPPVINELALQKMIGKPGAP